MDTPMSSALIVCIDANVYISALAFGGKPSKIVELALAKKFHLVTSEAILSEVKRNLVRKLDFTEAEVNSFFEIICEISSVYAPTGTFKLINHKADNLVLETALMGGADILVTGDKKDLLPLKIVNTMIIETPSALLERLKSLGIE